MLLALSRQEQMKAFLPFISTFSFYKFICQEVRSVWCSDLLLGQGKVKTSKTFKSFFSAVGMYLVHGCCQDLTQCLPLAGTPGCSWTSAKQTNKVRPRRIKCLVQDHIIVSGRIKTLRYGRIILDQSLLELAEPGWPAPARILQKYSALFPQVKTLH